MAVALDPAISAVARLALALLFAAAAAHKLRDVDAFRGILADYRLAPEAAVPALAALVVAAEIAVALALVVSFVLPGATSEAVSGTASGMALPAASGAALGVAPTAALAAGALLFVYGVAMAANLARGRREIDCGCGGPGQPLHPALLARNAMLLVVCALAALPIAARPLGALDAATIVAGVGALALAWAAAAQLLALALAPRGVQETSG